MNQEFIANSLDALRTIAQTLIPLIQKHKKIAFLGEMGAGKTTFIKILCEEMGVKDITSSPTFAIINQYQSPQGKIYHTDLYRLKNEQEAFSIGLLELFEDENAYCFVEWPQIVEGYFPEPTIWIRITALENEKRLIELRY